MLYAHITWASRENTDSESAWGKAAVGISDKLSDDAAGQWSTTLRRQGSDLAVVNKALGWKAKLKSHFS